MSEEVKILIERGLYEENLRKLTNVCSDLFDVAPAVYGTLIFIFQSLAEEYDCQGISVDRYELITKTIKEPLILLVNANQDRAAVFERLNEVFRAFRSLKL